MEEKSLTEIFGITDIAVMSKDEIKGLICDIEETIKNHGELVEFPVKHHFSDGVYAREMNLPKGALIVGKIHKKQNLNILSAGEVSVLSVDGLIKVKAPFTLVASEGVKRVIFAHEDCVWTTIHGTHEKDVDKIEEEFIAKSYEDLPLVIEAQIKEEKCLG